MSKPELWTTWVLIAQENNDMVIVSWFIVADWSPDQYGWPETPCGVLWTFLGPILWFLGQGLTLRDLIEVRDAGGSKPNKTVPQNLTLLWECLRRPVGLQKWGRSFPIKFEEIFLNSKSKYNQFMTKYKTDHTKMHNPKLKYWWWLIPADTNTFGTFGSIFFYLSKINNADCAFNGDNTPLATIFKWKSVNFTYSNNWSLHLHFCKDPTS